MENQGDFSSAIGLIAGNRRLPLEFCRIFKNNNPQAKIYAVCIKGDTSSEINRLADTCFWIGPQAFSKARDFFLENDVRKVIFLGQITPLRLFREYNRFDPQIKSLLGNLEDWRPDTIFRTLAKYLEEKDIEILDSRSFLESILSPGGVFSSRYPTPQERKDIELGLEVATKISNLDVGQTIVVKNRMVISVEAFEGTDACILRARKLSFFRKGGVVVKIAGKNQDLRFDIPTVGVRTLKVMKRAGLSCLALEEEKTFILEKQRFIEFANKNSISLVGLRVS